ncbi:hypothetical protein TbgDal_IX1210 [Trypanosoma brucei gambiense DAL972]|uniref:Uncharacterized protein n=1 Tax=Trypanosoma brucei gambiense (strain MHOM/CI/86/DAL972) TaxID=679716 RepID=C9ZXA2_TRYB9|nr:hypothetical protein TbgDal_IX1210 [Trypanosoma brucei gambiense DAL972]CBH14046.1 hypothetical protein TbgDal_IX1210 [Trypanosoma brucei gambiense DAL972]|eukprot:XP_011776317.1 hypothetical protein TbgDal_IX1210 [Trypanosoma brucei gambiense DAL972]
MATINVGEVGGIMCIAFACLPTEYKGKQQQKRGEEARREGKTADIRKCVVKRGKSDNNCKEQ